MLYIIADDLTGASDTGVKLIDKGYNAEILIINDFISLENIFSNNEILIIDSETRELKGKKVDKKIEQIIENINIKDDDIIYKKVDSTMRGNVGRELEILLNNYKYDFCLFSPALPSNNRKVLDGKLFVNNKLLGESEYYDGDIDYKEASIIKKLIQEQTDLKIENLYLDIVEQGKEKIKNQLENFTKEDVKIIIVDAISKNNLKNIISASNELSNSVLYSGSAGLAEYLDEIFSFHKNNYENITPVIYDKNLFLSGSRRSILEEQVNYFKNNKNIFELVLDPEGIINNRKNYLKEVSDTLFNSIKDYDNLIVWPDPNYKNNSVLSDFLNDNNLTFYSFGKEIKGFFGELARIFLNNFSKINLIITGGDTAAGICEDLNISNLSIVKEVLHGIPLSIGYSVDLGNINIVTKAGGFGEKSVYIDILQEINKKVGV
ncbi:MAG: four-carbon acid sugar kinase family protein [Bacillota bacterium]